MKRRNRIAAGAAAVVIAGAAYATGLGVRGVKDPPPPPPPPPPPAVIGDSVAFRAGEFMPGVDNEAVGGTTVCDTANETYSAMPLAYDLLIHVGGHSWGNYDEATAEACLDYIISRYGGTQVWIATAPVPGVTPPTGAIYCGDGAAAALVLSASGIPYNAAAVIGNPDYELRQRLADFNAYKLAHHWPTNVHVVRWDGGSVEHNGPPDCIHQTDAGAQRTADLAAAAGFPVGG